MPLVNALQGSTVKGLSGMGARFALKRLFDVIMSMLVVVIGAPVFMIVAVLVKLSSPGPVFFVQDRAGKDDTIFRMYKFRTMAGKPNDSLLVWTESEEARITKIGRFLRDYGLDELPQVLNILRGDMSIVGPRPPLPMQAEQYTDCQKIMFSMRPGVISLADVKGRRSIPMEERVEWHVWYVQNWSMRLDLEILWKTLFIVLRRQNAFETDVREETPDARMSG
jgi:lipopolysaccharide/colanic/teichoic acid biosynthesis glycosyltransferase